MGNMMQPAANGDPHESTLAQTTPFDNIASNPGLMLKWKFLQKEGGQLTSRIERMEASLSGIQIEVYQLFGFFFVFQGVIFAALSQSSALECKSWWIPLLLVVFAYVGMMVAMWYKLRASDHITRRIAHEKENSKAVHRKLQGLGHEYDVNNFDEAQPVSGTTQRPSESSIFWKVLIAVAITVFSAIIAVACPIILCHQKKCEQCPKCG